jgi:hypothetical protein
VTVQCPNGHPSSASDYCDLCGAPIGSPTGAAVPSRAPTPADDVTSVTIVDRCPVCGHVSSPGDRFCERCGFDLSDADIDTDGVGQARWVASIVADRDYHDRLDLTGFVFPTHARPRTVVLDGDELLIGRSTRDGAATPDIDLAQDPEDPAVSRRHARLVRRHDGTYEVIDEGSSNGTFLNAGSVPLEPGVAHRLEPGDRIHLGAWTTITVSRALRTT